MRDLMCSLLMSEVPSNCVVCSLQVVRVAGICVEGLVHLFQCSLTNQIAAPLSAQSSIQFVSTASKVSNMKYSTLGTLLYLILIV